MAQKLCDTRNKHNTTQLSNRLIPSGRFYNDHFTDENTTVKYTGTLVYLTNKVPVYKMTKHLPSSSCD